MIVNWLEQITFMSDDDVGILSSSGVTTRVTAGDNFSVNDVSLFELGFRYDLIIVGGSVFDANIIHQMNVLFDNDVVGAVANFETAGEGSLSSSGNLLWNQPALRRSEMQIGLRASRRARPRQSRPVQRATPPSPPTSCPIRPMPGSRACASSTSAVI